MVSNETTDGGPVDGGPIAGAFRAARGWLGWSQQEAAKRSRVGLSTLRALEQGNASAGTIIAVGDAYRDAGVGMTDCPDGGLFIGDLDAAKRYARHEQ